VSENAFYLPCFNFILYLTLFYSVYFFLCETNSKLTVMGGRNKITIADDFAYFIVENYEQSCRNVKEVLKRRE
jgi:hypothetical protein